MTVESLAIGVISFDRAALTRACIESLDAHTTRPFHLVVADNGSRELAAVRLLDDLAERSRTTVVRLGSNRGPSAGRNAIVASLPPETDVLAFLDNDARALPRWDDGIVEALSAGFDIVQPKLLEPDSTTVQRGPTRSWSQPFLVHPEYIGTGLDRSAPEVSQRVAVEHFGGTVAMRRRVLASVGPYDERLWFGEDYDYAFRARSAGFRACYEPSSELIHDHVFDPGYEAVRSNIDRELVAHIVLWEKHRRLMLGPDKLAMICWLLEHDEPLFLERSWRPASLFRRLRRRIVQKRIYSSLRSYWTTEEEGATATADAARVRDSAGIGLKSEISK
ncbi:MAG: glycosyltransferase [Thermoanaerobaculia bacterium]